MTMTTAAAEAAAPLPKRTVVHAEPLDDEVTFGSATLRRTQLKQHVLPYLPPPVVRGWKNVDPILEPYLGPEPTITLVGSLMLAIVVWQVIKILSSLSSGRAIVDDDEDDIVMLSSTTAKRTDYAATILLCGPPHSGKTRLFYQLMHLAADGRQANNDVSTVTSLRANVNVVSFPSSSSANSNSTMIRFMDYPGHASLQSSQFLNVLFECSGSTGRSSSGGAIVLVLDTTQPMAPVADIVYQLLAHAHNAKANQLMLDIFVACHKSDAPNAKNWRRIKIQLRTELERLLKVRSMELQQQQQNDNGASSLWWTPGKPLDLEKLPNATLQFCSTSCVSGVGMQDLMDFVVDSCCGGGGERQPETMAKVELI